MSKPVPNYINNWGKMLWNYTFSQLFVLCVGGFDRLNHREPSAVPELVECEETFGECFDSETEK